MTHQINTIATDATIVDIINSDFTLVGNPEANDNRLTVSADRRTLSWNIGSISDEAKSATFRVEANNDLYGAAWTNEAAWLYFNPVSENHFYADSKYDNTAQNNLASKVIAFNQPVVPVPPIAANDDYYGVIAGNVLTTTLDAAPKGVLANDPSAVMHTIENWTTLEVKAVLVENSGPSKGELLEFHDNGTFKYQSDEEADGTDTFRYQIVTTVQYGEEEPFDLIDEATVTISITALEKYDLTVIYKDIDTDDALTPDPDPNSGKSYPQNGIFRVDIVDFANYSFSSYHPTNLKVKPGTLEGTMPGENLTVTLYYQKVEVGSTIFYYKGDYDTPIGSPTGYPGPSGKWGSEAKLTDDMIEKYLEDHYSVKGNPSDFKITLDKDASENIFKILYTKDQYPYTVEYYFTDSGSEEPVESYDFDPVDYGTQIDEIDDPEKDLTGYVLNQQLSTILPYTIIDSDNIIKAYYDRKQVGWIIEYYYYTDGQTDKVWLADAAGTPAQWGAEVSLAQDQINAYLNQSGTTAGKGYYATGSLEEGDYKITLDLNPEKNVIEVVYKSVPVANDDWGYETDIGEAITINVLANDYDPDGDELTVTKITNNPLYGTAAINDNGTITYTHTISLDHGYDSFVYEIVDENGNTDTATVTIYIHPYYPLNLYFIDIDTGARIVIDGSVIDDNPSSLLMKRGSEYLIGADTREIPGFTYLGIFPQIEQPPVAYSFAALDVYDMPEDEERMIPEDLDIADLLESEDITMIEGGLYRYLIYQRDQIDYTVEYYLNRNQDVPFEIWDGSALYESIVEDYPQPETLDLTVFELDRVEGLPLFIGLESENNVIRVYYAATPIAEDDSATTPQDQPVTINVLVNDSDPGGGSLTVVSTTDPENATVVINQDGTLTVTPAAGFVGTITFDYTIENEDLRQATATVTITVTEIDQPEPTPLPPLPVITPAPEPVPLAPVTPAPLPVITPITDPVPLAPALPTIDVVQEELPQSGENAPLWPAGFALLVLAGSVKLLIQRSKKELQGK